MTTLHAAGMRRMAVLAEGTNEILTKITNYQTFMRFKLSLLLLLASIVPALAQNTGVSGVVLDASGNPVSGAAVMLNDQGIVVTTGPAGEFRISNAVPGTDVITVAAYGYNDLTQPVQMVVNTISDLGQIKLKNSQSQNMILEEQQE